MPELPEVETVRRGLMERVVGDRIVSVWLGDKPEPFRSARQEIVRVLVGARIGAVRRMGKHIVMDLEPRASDPRSATGDGRQSLIIHLGMTGAVQVALPEADTLKHTHAVMHLDSGKEIRFVDPRRFGRIWIGSDFETIGMEPLLVTFEQFAMLFRGRKTPIKSALLNQKLLRGLGNIYADESLFRACIRPRRRTASLTRAEMDRLFEAVRQVLRAAIAAGGSSISDYFDVEGEPGLFQTRHRVYAREGKPCLVCRTPIKRIVVAGRGTHYCPECQK
ncbi:MAG: bifunctional DNA-formamidopyrimidine glycosylase/DNA-(apurinic or apyrimidinic site) lyase [Terriglobales bacterium]|jgi:formamidopyrimidine-DNA glycosylase